MLKEIFDKHQVLFAPTAMFMIHTKYLPLKILLKAVRFFDLRDYLIKKYFINHA